MTDRSKGQPFDERAALDALEQFQSEIKRYRQEREAATDDFDEFVRTLPAAEHVFPPEKPGTPTPGPAEKPAADRPATRAVTGPPASTVQSRPVPDAGSHAHQSGHAAQAKPSPPAIAPRPVKKPAAESAAVLPAPERSRSKVPLFAALLAITLIIAGAAYWNTRRVEPAGGSVASAPAPETPSPETAASEAPAPAPAAPADAPAPAATRSEITTLRPVWVRVIADGERIVERELPAGAKIPFTVQKTVVIRAGDAGAVRLILRGADHGTLGGDGDVVTRTFTLPEDGH